MGKPMACQRHGFIAEQHTVLAPLQDHPNIRPPQYKTTPIQGEKKVYFFMKKIILFDNNNNNNPVA